MPIHMTPEIESPSGVRKCPDRKNKILYNVLNLPEVIITKL